MKKSNIFYGFLYLTAIIFLASCDKDKDDKMQMPKADFTGTFTQVDH